MFSFWIIQWIPQHLARGVFLIFVKRFFTSIIFPNSRKTLASGLFCKADIVWLNLKFIVNDMRHFRVNWIEHFHRWQKIQLLLYKLCDAHEDTLKFWNRNNASGMFLPSVFPWQCTNISLKHLKFSHFRVAWEMRNFFCVFRAIDVGSLWAKA